MKQPRHGPGLSEVHLDTDLGTNVDDLAALVICGSAEVELTGITTCIDPGGWGAGYLRHALRLAGATTWWWRPGPRCPHRGARMRPTEIDELALATARELAVGPEFVQRVVADP